MTRETMGPRAGSQRSVGTGTPDTARKTPSATDGPISSGRAPDSVQSPWRLVDMHCHPDQLANGDEVARDAERLGIALFCATVSPADSLIALERFDTAPNVFVGMGLHPWWLADGRCGESDIETAARLAATGRLIGEIGLDFNGSRAKTATLQERGLSAVLQSCARHPIPGRVLSLHAGKAAGRVLDLLEEFNIPAHASCIFHWFSGTSDELSRARRAGCLFSVNEHMLASKRGREYARQIPLERLLIETDAPRTFGQRSSATSLGGSLERTLDTLASIRPESRNRIADHTAALGADLLSPQRLLRGQTPIEAL